MNLPLYFDNHATTPVDPRVTEAMLPYLQDRFGNAESVQHPYGWQAKSGVEKARAQVASLIGAHVNEIVFTSGATESIHLAILGYLETHFDTHGFSNPAHIITSNAEHKATLEVCARASRYGHAVTVLPVDAYGQVSAEQVISALRSNTALVSLMHANNEIGTINPIASIGAKLRERGILFHVDAAQTAGRETIDVNQHFIDMLSISAHKLYGPKGVGAFYLRKGVHLSPYMVGGGQERGLRGGTPNVPGIIGLGRACEIAKAEMDTDRPRLKAWRDRIIERVQSTFEGIKLNGHPTERLCNNISFTIEGVQPDQLLLGLHDIAYSSASACSAGGTSHVLKAIGQETTDAFVTTARFGLGRFNTEAQVETLIERLIEVIQNAREVSKVYSFSGNSVPQS